jgi:hypothetical protein
MLVIQLIHTVTALVPTKGWLKSPTGNRGELMLSRPAEAVPEKTAKSAQRVVSNYWATLTGFPCFSSVVRQMPGYKEGARPAFPYHGGLPPKCPSPKSQTTSAKAIPTPLGSTPKEPSNQNPFHEGQVSWWDNLLPVAITLGLKKSRPSATTKIPLV